MDINKIQKKKNMGGKPRMTVSMGAILGIKGKTAEKIRLELKSPNRKDYLDECSKKAAHLKKK